MELSAHKSRIELAFRFARGGMLKNRVPGCMDQAASSSLRGKPRGACAARCFRWTVSAGVLAQPPIADRMQCSDHPGLAFTLDFEDNRRSPVGKKVKAGISCRSAECEHLGVQHNVNIALHGFSRLIVGKAQAGSLHRPQKDLRSDDRHSLQTPPTPHGPVRPRGRIQRRGHGQCRPRPRAGLFLRAQVAGVSARSGGNEMRSVATTVKGAPIG